MALNTCNDNDVARVKAVLGRTATTLKSLGHKHSARACQRAIAFYLGHHANGWIDSDDLREWCKVLGAYNRANFAQNMTKEGKRGLVTGNIRVDGGWELTEKGKLIAAELVASLDSFAEQMRASFANIRIKVSKVSCGLCADVVMKHEHALTCSKCGLTLHVECNSEMNHGSRHCPSGICPNGWSDTLKTVEPTETKIMTENTVEGRVA